MNYDIADALKRDVPEPPRPVDPDRIIGLHRQRRQRRRTVAGVGALAVAAILTPTAFLRADLGRQEASPASGAAVEISALERTEPLPAKWLEQENFAFLPEEASRVATMSGDGAVYLWADGDRLCEAVLYGVSYSVPGGSAPQGPEDCTRADSLLTEGMVTFSDTSGEFSGTQRHLVVVVPDGYTDVTLGDLTQPVDNNVAVFSWDYLANVGSLARPTDGLVLTGAGQPPVTVPVP